MPAGLPGNLQWIHLQLEMLVDISFCRGVNAGLCGGISKYWCGSNKEGSSDSICSCYPKASSPTLGAKFVTRGTGDPVPPGLHQGC